MAAGSDGYARAVTRFEDVYRRLHAASAASPGPALVRDDWRERHDALARDLLPAPPTDLIRHPAILHQMFVGERYLDAELPRVLAALGGDGQARRWLREDPAGAPLLTPGHDHSYETSANLVHHVHHLVAFRAATGVAPWESGTIVEWGGGYGSLARLIRRLSPGDATYALVDAPILCAIAWRYLSDVLGEDAVAVVDEGGLRPGRVNLVPAERAAEAIEHADLFVSTWALNESLPAAQRLVAGRAWFGARHLLLGMHVGEPLLDVAAADGARIVPLGALAPGQRYALR